MATHQNSLKIGIVTTLRGASKVLKSFLDYHLYIGFAHIFLFFDDPKDPAIAIASEYPQVSVILCNAELRQQQAIQNSRYAELAPYLDTEHMARQLLNLETGIQLATAQNLDWLLHIDIDELLYLPAVSLQDCFQQFSDEVGQVIFRNAEAAPHQLEVQDYFREIFMFKAPPDILTEEQKQAYLTITGKQWYFLAYTNGKAAIRLTQEPSPETEGVHRFKDNPAAPKRAMGAGIILHYAYCGLENYKNRYRFRGNFKNKWFGQIEMGLSFHQKSRDVAFSEGYEKLEELYRQTVMFIDDSIVKALLEQGILATITTPQEILNSLSMGSKTCQTEEIKL